MAEVIELDDYRPHVATVDQVTGHGHVIPVAMLEAIAEGDLNLADCDNHEAIVRAAFSCLLELLEDEF